MKTSYLIVIGLMATTLFSCSDIPTVEELKHFAATESYPEDTYFETVQNKTACIIVAHDDDDCAMSGTISKLTADGWKITQLSLKTHIIPSIGKNAAHIICEGNERILGDGIYKNHPDSIEISYVPIPYADIEKYFLKEKVAEALVAKLDEIKPTVIFTLDNIKGGYGHPDHIFISQLVLDLFNENNTTAERIYQAVYTNHMEHEIVDVWLGNKMKEWGYPNASDIANKMYGIDGMPEPDVEVTIGEHGKTKMNYLRAYPENAKRNLRKFLPYYEEFDAETYFNVFRKEYFRVFKK